MEYHVLGGILPFITYFVSGLAFLTVFLYVYLRVTPYNDFELIAEGNTAAAIALAGAALGYTFPLARSIEQAYGPIDFTVWGLVSMAAQILVFLFVKRLFATFVDQVRKERNGAAILLAALSIAVGLINAAAMTE